MQGCKYQSIVKCTHCDVLLHRGCKKFITAHAKVISQCLQPFVYSSKYKPKGKVMWSKDQNRAKSLALQCALRNNLHIKKYSLSQTISLALDQSLPENEVVYVECVNKLNGDIDKLKGVLISFIESSLLNNTIFVVYVAPTVQFSLDFPKI